MESVASEEGGQLIVSFGLPSTWCQVHRKIYMHLFPTSIVLHNVFLRRGVSNVGNRFRDSRCVSLIASGIGLGIPDMSLIASGIGCYSRHFRCASGVLRLFNSILYITETKKRKKTERGRGRSRRRGHLLLLSSPLPSPSLSSLSSLLPSSSVSGLV